MSDEKRRPGHVYRPDNPLPEHLRPKPEPQVQQKLRDTDSTQHAYRFKAFAYSGWLGILGMFAGMKLALDRGESVLPYVVGGLVIGWALAYFGGMTIMNVSGRLGHAWFVPHATPSAREYSLAESLIVRGLFLEAAAELQRASAAYPEDPAPKLRLARLYRDALQRPEDAITWFRRIIDMDTDDATEQAVMREMIEVYTHRLQRPRAAAPWLARLADRHPDSTAGAWAKRELAELKREMRTE